MELTLANANHIENEKIRTHHAKIVVECTTGKPYYSIEWFDIAKQEYYLGYSSYCIDNVLGWLKEFFEIVEAPKTNADRIRSMTDDELVVFLDEFSSRCINCVEDAKNQSCPIYKEGYYCRPQDIMGWLKQPAE